MPDTRSQKDALRRKLDTVTCSERDLGLLSFPLCLLLSWVQNRTSTTNENWLGQELRGKIN